MGRLRMRGVDRGDALGRREIGARSPVSSVWRGKWWIIGATAAAFLVAFVSAGFVKPRYTSTATVQLASQSDDASRAGHDAAPAQAPALGAEAAQSQVQLVTSRDLARQAIAKLDLLGNPEFDPLATGISPAASLLVWLGVERDLSRMSPEDRVLDAYFNRLMVYPDVPARALRIEFSSVDPELAAKAANVIGELYLQMQGQAKKDAAKAASDRLARAYQALKTKVAEADGKIDAFRAGSGRLLGDTSITTRQIADLVAQIAAARTAQFNAQSKSRRIRELMREGRLTEIAEVAGDAQIRGIALQTVSLRAEFAVESRTLLPGHPRMRELRAALDSDDNVLETAALQMARDLEGQARVAGARVDALTTLKNAQQKALAAGEAAQAKLRDLERDGTAAHDQLESFLVKHPEASASTVDDPSPPDASFISRAVVPELPASPERMLTLVIGTLAGFLMSLCAVVGRELLSGPSVLERPHDAGLRSETGVSSLAQTDASPVPPTPVRPMALSAEEAVAEPLSAGNEPAEGADEGHRVDDAVPREAGMEAANGRGEDVQVTGLAQRIRQCKPEMRGASVLVCGLERGAGSSAAAIEIARTLAASDRAILVNLADDGPDSNRLIDGADGFADVLLGRKSLTEVIRRDPGSRLLVLPAGGGAKMDRTGEEQLNLAIDALIATYDYVVFHGAPLADKNGSLAIAGWTDMTVLFVSAAAASLGTLAIDTLIDAGALNVQLVMAGDDAPMTANPSKVEEHRNA